jgi:hypothetical protein
MNRIDDIARYAEGLMAADEQAAFEASLAADASLQQQLQLYREVHTGLQQHFQPNIPLQQTLQDLRGEFFTKKPARVIPFKRYIVAVAAVLIAIAFVWQPWKPALYKQYADITMVAPAERGEASQDVSAAVAAFNKKDFTTAASLLEKVYDSTNSFTSFYYGVALMQSNETAKARTVLQQLYAGESAFKQDAAFYLALSYLKENDKAGCINWLQKIPDHAKAQELLKRLQAN